ncbi:hypothetical protein ACMA5I_01765 [Paracoccaceae bacterium GXU_MW_L88]
MTAKTTLFYMIDLGKIEWQSVLLLASLKEFMDPEGVEIVAYAPGHRLPQIDARVIAAHERAGVEIRPLPENDIFDGVYLQGNKMLAAAAKRDGEMGVFLDTDILAPRPFHISELVTPGHFSARYALASVWANNPRQWGPVCDHFGIAPGHHARHARNGQCFYFNAGVVTFPEVSATGQRFGETWLDTALEIDHRMQVQRKRPWLDQIALAAAVARMDLPYTILDDNWNRSIPKTIHKHTDLSDARLIHYHGGRRPYTLRRFNMLDFCSALIAKHSDFPDIMSMCMYFVEKYPDNDFRKDKQTG